MSVPTVPAIVVVLMLHVPTLLEASTVHAIKDTLEMEKFVLVGVKYPLQLAMIIFHVIFIRN